ncbi:MAG: glycosyltransferase family 9 protein [Verrucomicrobiae bacterium]|nr:glycosyltransferase family 9 protein [Verrucomicrobiae bacterium]
MPESQSPCELDRARRVLVIKPSSLGDVIHTLPAVTMLHRHRPDLEIDWLVNTEWSPLLAGNPALSRVIPMPRRQWRGWRDLPKARRWAKDTLGSLQPDLVLDFQGLLRSALLAKASHAKGIVGFRRAREGASLFYDKKVEIDAWDSTHAVDRYLTMVGSVGVPVDPTPGADASELFPLPPGDPIELPDEFADRPFLLLHPFSRGRGKSMNFRETADFCREFHRASGLPVILVGAGVPWNSAAAELPEGVLDLLDQTSLTQLIWLMRRARFIVSVDSGPMHLAAALTGELLSLHTWTDPLMVGPWRKDAWVWRGDFLGRVGEVRPGQLPENRKDRDRFDGGIVTPENIKRLATFVANRSNE